MLARILVVEDDPSVARTLVRLLQSCELWTVAVAASVAEAKALLVDWSSAWVGFVVDVGLPEGQTAGVDLLAHFRATYPQTPAMILTGQLERGIANAAASLDASFVCKPPGALQIQPFLARVKANVSSRAEVTRIASAASSRFQLTRREQQVLECALRGDESEAFCLEAGISPRTFRAHAAAAIAKASAPSLRELAMRLMREQLERR